MDVVALVVSGLSLVVAAIGTVLSNRRSREALTESRKAATAALWSDAEEAVQRLIGFDPASEPIGDRLANLRIAMIALVDELDDWAGLDQWLEAERALGATLGRQVMEQAKPGDTVNQRLKVLDPLQTWAQAVASNLRRFRQPGLRRRRGGEAPPPCADLSNEFTNATAGELLADQQSSHRAT